MKTRLKLIALALVVGFPLLAQNIFIIGDSHVAGKIYPQEIKKIIEEAKPEAHVSFWGKNGAGFYTFNKNAAYMENIFKATPDILVVHLGTNGSYQDSIDPDKTYEDIETFYNNIMEKLPDCKIVFVSPFYNKIRGGQGKRSSSAWKMNENAGAFSDILSDFVKENSNTFLVDNNIDADTLFIDSPDLIRQDNVHLTVKGYQVLGDLVADELLQIQDLW